MLSREGKTPSEGLGWGMGRMASYLKIAYAMLGWHALFITRHIFNKLVLGARPWGNGGGPSGGPSEVPAPRELTSVSTETQTINKIINRMIIQVVQSAMKK